MFVIRRFVGYTSAAAAIGAVAAVVAFAQTGTAATARPLPQTVAARDITLHDSAPAPTAVPAPSAACTAAVRALKTAIATDRVEDAAEREVAKANPDPTAGKAEDQVEHAQFHTLFANIRTACAPVEPAVARRFTPSSQCTDAVQAVKASWAHGKPTTRAQWTQLFTLLEQARTACRPTAFTSSFGSRLWHG